MIAAAYQYPASMHFPSFPADGIMGLSSVVLSRPPSGNFIQTLVTENQLQAPVFSFGLTPGAAELTIGGVNEDLFTGDFVNVPVPEPVCLNFPFLSSCLS